jgi:hypothetical protein
MNEAWDYYQIFKDMQILRNQISRDGYLKHTCTGIYIYREYCDEVGYCFDQY